MLEMIKKALAEAEAGVWTVRETKTRSAELFFVRRALDMRRLKETRKYLVRVYRDFEKDGRKMRGASQLTLVPSQSREEISQAVRDAFFAASFVENPWYPLPEKQVGRAEDGDGGFAGLSAEDAALKMAGAIFDADGGEAFVNSAEIFAVSSEVRLLSSFGTDVAYARDGVNGEFVVQCREPEDVESHRAFAYDRPDCGALKEKVAAALRQVGDRAQARPELAGGIYDLILTDDKVAEVLRYYIARSSASMVYPGYSDWKPEGAVQPENTDGERLSLTLRAEVPFSGEGIPMTDRPVIRDGKVAAYHGGARLSYYLGVPATGDYTAFDCENGTLPLAEMKKEPHLLASSFSDFQMDPLSGHFGGEIRLAYWFDGERTRIVTGGSVNGSIRDCAGSLVFSTERYSSLPYNGPFAVKLRGVRVAGPAG